MTALRSALVLSLFAIGCASAGSGASPAITPPPVVVDPTCATLANAKRELGILVFDTYVPRGKRRPRDPAAFGAELRATAVQARTVMGDEAGVALGHATADLFDGLADRARAIADAGENAPAVEAAATSLHDAIRGGGPLLEQLRERCGEGEGGRLPPREIQRVVRAGFKVFRTCYEDGLRREPKLAGRMGIRFVIELDGTVKGATARPLDALDWAPANDELGPMPDAAVTACVVKEFTTLRFPPPKGGAVTVTYPIQFSPGP